MMRITHETYGQVFGTVYLALMTNLLLVVSGLPFVLTLVSTDPVRAWPVLAVLAPLAAPGVTAAFCVYRAFSAEGTVRVARTFVRAWRATFRRAFTVGAMVSAALVVLGVDVRATWTTTVGAVAIPVFVGLGVLAFAVGVVGLVAVAERPDARLRDLLKASLYLAVRRWYLTAVSLTTLGVLAGIVAARPAIGFGLAAAPLLYVVWANSQFALRPVLDRQPTAV